jgi:tetratricopeptide (TPR) repeat protein
MAWSAVALCGLVIAASISATECLAQNVKASDWSVAAGRDIVNSQLIIGIPPEKLEDVKTAITKLSQLNEQQQQTINILQNNLGVNKQALKAFFIILGESEVSGEQLMKKLLEIAGHYKELLAQVTLVPSDGTEIAKTKTAAKEALKAGQLDRADELLGKVQELQDAALVSMELERAATSAQRGQLAMAQLRYSDAARQFADAAQRVPESRPDIRLGYLDLEAAALFQEGEEHGDYSALIAAIERYGVLLVLRPRDRVPLEWAMTQMNLGNALERVGERENGTARLEQAATAYRAALEERTRDRVPFDWAMTQMDLGSALERLGEREDGTARLGEAVAAYRAALEVRTRDRVPLQWAMTQMNLGAALHTLGARESGTARLEESVTAYRATLEEYTRDRAPLQWAMTQMNLGNVLQTLGEREGNADRLEEAVTAYRAALQECTRDRVPLQWAQTENNLGTVLRILAARESGTGRLDEAVATYRAALEECPRDRAPLQWAMIQNNLGIALKTLAERESGTARLEEALTAYREALTEYTPDRVPLQWAMTQMNLGNALSTLGEREGGTVRQEEAVEAFRNALARDPLPIDRANIEFNMGLALIALGKHAEALSCFRQAQTVFRAVGMVQLAERCVRLIILLRGEIENDSPASQAP